MRCRYNMAMHTAGPIYEFTLRLYRSGEAQLRLWLLPLGRGDADHTALIFSSDKKKRQVRQFSSFLSKPVFHLARAVDLIQVAEPRARSNTSRRIFIAGRQTCTLRGRNAYDARI